MTNLFLIGVYSLLILTALFVIGLTLRKRRRSKLDSNIVAIAAALLGWEVLEIAFYVTTDDFLAHLFFDLKLPFVALVIFFWLFYIVRFYGVERALSKPVTVALLVVPLFTCGLALTTNYHELIRQEFVITQFAPIREYVMVRGPWFWYHSITCYLMIISAFIMGLFQHSRISKASRLPSRLLVTALMIAFTFNLAVILIDLPIDLSLIGGSLTLVFLYLATKNYQGLGFIIERRSEAFQHLDEGVFVVDRDSSIIAVNRAAREWLQELGMVEKSPSFNEVATRVEQLATEQTLIADELNGVDYRFSSGKLYNVRQKPILNNEGSAIGSFVFVSDETDNREIIEYLDKHAGLDALTGLSNRRQHQEDLAFLDREEHYPLAVVYGDLNDLKTVNDEHGHHQGDMLLRLVAETLKSLSPPKARIGRIGGDEFMVLVPNHTEEQVQDIIEEIRTHLERESGRYPFAVSCAFGYSVKNGADQAIEHVVNTADAQMYSDKQRIKAGRTVDR